MALDESYPEQFERLWRAYPKWPTGRSKKTPSYKAFQSANKALRFTDDDIAAIERDIEERKRYCETWQRGNQFGPVMFATYFNQRLWNEPYKRINAAPSRPANEASLWQRMGYASEADYYAGRRMH